MNAADASTARGTTAGTGAAGATAAVASTADRGPTVAGHARHRLDEVIHAPVRFSVVAALATVDEADFATLRDAVEVSDSVLSKQVSTLEAAGYVKVRKGYVGKRPRTWLSLTRAGRTAYEQHLAALREIAGA